MTDQELACWVLGELLECHKGARLWFEPGRAKPDAGYCLLGIEADFVFAPERVHAFYAPLGKPVLERMLDALRARGWCGRIELDFDGTSRAYLWPTTGSPHDFKGTDTTLARAVAKAAFAAIGAMPATVKEHA